MQLTPKLAGCLLWLLGGCGEIEPTPYHVVLPDIYVQEEPYYLHPIDPFAWRKL